jgi:calcium-dependent protein kinase
MKTQKLQQAALTAIAVQASANDIRELKEMFVALDYNGDGSLSLEELKKGLGNRENGETLYKLLEAADTDKSGEIDYTEFIAATLDAQTYLRNDYLRTAFDLFDKDGSGMIDADEICQILDGGEVQMDKMPTKALIVKYI